MTDERADVEGGDGASAAVDALSYTDASRELDEIVEFFEQREVDVDQLVARLERATLLIEELDRRLRRTRLQVEQLAPRLAAVIEPSDPGPAAVETRPTVRRAATPDGRRDGDDESVRWRPGQAEELF